MPTRSEALTPAPEPPRVLEQIRVLLAEEDDFFRWVLDRLLAESGYQVTPVSTGRGLLSSLGRSFEGLWSPVPHVIIASATLPEVGGLDVLERLHGAGWRAPFIVVAEGGDVAVQQRAWRAGASYLLEKPFDPERLIGAVDEVVKGAARP